MTTLPLKSSRNEQRALIRFLWAKGLNANQINSEMRPVYGDKCFTTHETSNTCMFGVRSLLAAEKALLIRNERPGRHVATTDATIAAVDAFVLSDGTNA